MNGLGRKAVTGIYWSGGTKLLSQAFAWLCTLVVARLLAPADYGTIAIAVIFAELIGYLAEFGVGSALIQRQELSRAEIDGLFWFVAGNSVVLALLMVAASAPLAAFFGTPLLSPILKAVSVNFLTYAVCSIQYALLAKELRFADRARADVAVDLFGSVTLIACAWSGLGVWSLAFSYVGKGLLSAIVLSRLTRYRPGLAFSWRRTSSLIRFGMHVLGGRLSYSLFAQSDSALVGRLLGVAALGSYAVALQLASAPLDKVTGVLMNVQYATFAKLQEDRPRARRYFLAFTRVSAAACFPMLIGLIWVAPDFVDTVLTGKWQAAVCPLRLLAAVGLFKCLGQPVSPMLTSLGKPQLPMRFNVVSLCALPPAFLVGARLAGINGVAAAWLLVYAPVSLASVHVALREIGLAAAEYVRNLAPVLASAALMLAGLAILQLATGEMRGWPRLVSEIAAGAAIYATALYGFFPVVRRDVAYAMGR